MAEMWCIDAVCGNGGVGSPLAKRQFQSECAVVGTRAIPELYERVNKKKGSALQRTTPRTISPEGLLTLCISRRITMTTRARLRIFI